MTLFSNLHHIRKPERDRAVEVLVDAFTGDVMGELMRELFVAKGLDVSEDKAPLSFEMPVRYIMRYGGVYAPSPRVEGIMAFLPDKRSNFGMWGMIRSGAIIPLIKLGSEAGKIIMPLFQEMEDDRKNLDIGPFIYLRLLGVAREYHGQGLGGKMLRALVEKAGAEGKALYLETQKESNIKFYEHFGFEVVKGITIPELDMPMWEMVRHAN